MRLFLLFLLSTCFSFTEEKVVDLFSLGKIVYHIENDCCDRISRISPSGEVEYEHQYHYDGQGDLIGESLIGDLGFIEHSKQEPLTIKTPFGNEERNQQRDYIVKNEDITLVYDDDGTVLS